MKEDREQGRDGDAEEAVCLILGVDTGAPFLLSSVKKLDEYTTPT